MRSHDRSDPRFASSRAGALGAVAAAILAAGCATPPVGPGEPTRATTQANAAVAKTLPFDDTRDFDFAERGFLATRAEPVIRAADGRVVWDLSATEFLEGEPPATANPSLWRVSRLHAKAGLFEAAPGVYQVRGFDLANVTFVRGETGWIVIDPLTSVETARAAFALLTEQLGAFPVKAIVYTHSHGDHFGGAGAFTEDAAADLPIIAPAGFLAESISENIIVGAAMRRRATYHAGDRLALDPKERLGAGLGVGLALGTISLVPPTVSIAETGETLTIDGVRMVFQITSGTEAPAEFNIGFPDLGVANIAENANPTHHNVLTPRGAKVRDARLWARSLTEAIDFFDYADVLVVSHGWPVFGRDAVAEYLAHQRDAYAFLHDQTVRMINQGMTLQEIAAAIELPEALAREWYNRPYYGDYRFNARAVYQYYLGWFDGNPVHLEPLPPVTAGEKYVAAIGGEERVLELARAAYDAGDYAWASELLDKLVFAGGGEEAKRLLAETYEQMGWQSENALWRNFYLTGAQELRNGVVEANDDIAASAARLYASIPTEALFDVMATRLDPERVGESEICLGFVFPDRDESITLTIRNGVLVHRPGLVEAEYNATLTVDRADFLDSLAGGTPLTTRLREGEASIDGSLLAFARFAGWLDDPDVDFAIVTP